MNESRLKMNLLYMSSPVKGPFCTVWWCLQCVSTRDMLHSWVRFRLPKPQWGTVKGYLLHNQSLTVLIYKASSIIWTGRLSSSCPGEAWLRPQQTWNFPSIPDRDKGIAHFPRMEQRLSWDKRHFTIWFTSVKFFFFFFKYKDYAQTKVYYRFLL